MNSKDEFPCILHGPLHLKWKSQEETSHSLVVSVWGKGCPYTLLGTLHPVRKLGKDSVAISIQTYVL